MTEPPEGDDFGDRPLTPADYDAILAFLPAFEAPSVDFGTYVLEDPSRPGVLLLDGEMLSPLAEEFIAALYAHGWIVAFDWVNWRYGRKLVQHPELIPSCRAETLRRLLTAHVRAGRFVSGHVLATLDAGVFTAILRRLRGLHPARRRPRPS